jgi:hypothetical protein
MALLFQHSILLAPFLLFVTDRGLTLFLNIVIPVVKLQTSPSIVTAKVALI